MCRRNGIIVLKPVVFNQHAPHFIISCSSTAPAATARSPSASADVPAVYSCWQVPSHLQDKHWTAVVRDHAGQLSERQLVLPDMRSSQVLTVLSKFEQAACIHTYMPGQCSGLPSVGPQRTHDQALPAQGPAAAGMRWHLPRCGLEFELTSDGSIVSLEHRGYRLSTQQLLVDGSTTGGVRYTLPEFHQYLVLQAQQGDAADATRVDRSEQLVLVPSGRVAVQRTAPGSSAKPLSASIQVELGEACNDNVKVSKLGMGHNRMK